MTTENTSTITEPRCSRNNDLPLLPSETEIGDDTGPTVCTACGVGFEIDDRGESVFVDTDRSKDADARPGLHALRPGRTFRLHMQAALTIW